jgi:adenine-specific DNA methylase
LMDFCFVWLKRLAPKTSFFAAQTTKTDQDAVGSARDGGVDLAEFTRRLSGVYVAAAVALKPGAALAFTYHHNDLDAYAPLVVACLDAGLVPTRVFGCPSEMRASTHIRGRNASTVETVFILRKPPVPPGLAVEFHNLDIGSAVDGRMRALRRAGLTATDADRACLRHSMLAVRAIAQLESIWDAENGDEERVASALTALTAGKPMTDGITLTR